MGIEQIEQPSQSRPITNGLESASAELAEIRPDHPLGDRDGLTVDDEVKKRHPAIFHLPVDGAPSSEKRVQGVFDLDFALVAGIINHVLASVATFLKFPVLFPPRFLVRGNVAFAFAMLSLEFTL